MNNLRELIRLPHIGIIEIPSFPSLPQLYRFRISGGWLEVEELQKLIEEIEKTGLKFDGITAWDDELVLYFKEVDGNDSSD